MSGYHDSAAMVLGPGHVSVGYGAAVAVADPGAPVGGGIEDIVGTAGTAGTMGVMNTADNVLLVGSDEGSLVFAHSWIR